MSHARALFCLKLFQSTPSAWRDQPETVAHLLVQSTPSAWRETSTSFSARSISSHFNPLPPHGGRLNLHLSFPPIRYFNPLPPHGGRPLRSKVERNDGCISIHSLRMEGDKMFCAFITRTVVFQSTPSAWRETVSEQIISKPKRNFNPLPPHGGRQRN